MSADNGCYVLKTKAVNPIPESDFEYRVVEASAIENIYYDAATGKELRDFIPQETYAYFNRSPVFTSEHEAGKYAQKLAEACPLLEYGICLLNHPTQFFQAFSEEEIEFYYAEQNAQIERIRQKRDEEREKKLAAAKVPVTPLQPLKGPLGADFIPRVAYGDLMQEGKPVHGSVQADKQGCYYFLPTDWNKGE